MIANISSPFSDAAMKFKIDYQIGKIEEKRQKLSIIQLEIRLRRF